MNIIIVLISISLTIAIVFFAVFIWAMKSGQYNDTYTPSIRMLFEDKKAHQTKPSDKNRT